MSFNYFDLLEWLAASTEEEKAAVWLKANPTPSITKFHLYLGKPYKPQFVIHFLTIFLLVDIKKHRENWQQTRYPIERCITGFWRSPPGQCYLIWSHFVRCFCDFNKRLDLIIWRLGFEKRLFLKRNFTGRR